MTRITLDTADAMRRNFRTARIVIVMVLAAVFASAHALVEGAILAGGTVVVEGSVKKIQHPSGGIIGEIAVSEGSKVAAGDLLIRLDATLVRANLDLIRNNLTAERARLARLLALRDGQATPAFPPELASAPNARSVLDGEARLASLLITSHTDQKRGLQQQIEQLRHEIQGLDEQQKSLASQRGIVAKDLGDLQPLYDRGNIQRQRISALQREVLRIDGAQGDARAKIGQAHAKIAETELHILRADHNFIADTVKQLRETETKIGDLTEKRVAAEDYLRRVEIRSPLTGTVHQLAVHTIGGVISADDVLMWIVPTDDRLVIDVRVRPLDIDQLSIGQQARIRFPAFDRRDTDDLTGMLTRIGADLTFDPQSRVSFYTATVRISDAALARLNGRNVIPGMPVDVFINTGERTVASYLLKPIRDQMDRALRER